MSADSHYDIIIIGTGAGGGTLAHHLAPSGKRILLLERGDFVPREKENWETKAVFGEARYRTSDTWRDADGRLFTPHTQYCVGGNTKFYGAALLRMRERDFGELTHEGGVSPAWPISYDELAPYYTKAEHLYHVHGERGADPTEPPADAPYAWPALTHEPRIQQLADDFRRIGNRPFPLPMGIMLDERNPQRSACIRCATCDGYPCLVQAKADAHVVCVVPALAHPNVTLMTRARVTRLETSASGREVTGVVVEHDGGAQRLSADIVVVACGAVNSAALLLASASDRHPDGLANGSGVVGRHYMAHNNSALIAISARPNPTRFQKTLAINDYYFGSPDFAHPLGHIAMLGKQDGDSLREGAPPFAPGFVLNTIARHTVDFWLTTEDLPDPRNRVELERDGTIAVRYRANNLASHGRLVATLKERLRLVDGGKLFPRSVHLAERLPIEATAHQCGTVRFGHDPRSSALDTDCRAHEVDNLYVVDASFFVSSSAVNPALTIIANAMRVGDHLLDRLHVAEGDRQAAVAAPAGVMAMSPALTPAGR